MKKMFTLVAAIVVALAIALIIALILSLYGLPHSSVSEDVVTESDTEIIVDSTAAQATLSEEEAVALAYAALEERFPLFCPKCKQAQLINVIQFNISVVIEPV